MTHLMNWRPSFAQKRHQKEVENDLKKAKMAIEESERFKTSFMRNMSHEIRTPLNGILGLSQVILNSDDANPKIKDDVKMIIEKGNSLLSSLNNVIDMSKLDMGHIQIKKSTFCLNTLMDKLYLTFLSDPAFMRKNACKSQKVELKCDKPYKNIEIVGDHERLYQILANLIDNALKFTEKGVVRFGYSISINSISKNRYITFYVKDTGIGMDMKYTEKIFDRFVQLDNSMCRKYNGTGLGLTISKELLEMMNGKIWCDSTVGKGTNFYCSIPYVTDHVLQNNIDMPQKKRETTRDWSSYTVLIVEDDIINYKALGGMLRNTKVSIIHSDNGVKAIEQVRINPKIDLVLMDINLPEMNGLEATGKILEINPMLPIIAQTTNEEEKCLEAGCIDYINKPIDMGLLFNKMSKFLMEK